TPYTSILALESEQAYQQQGIQRRRSPLRGVRLTSLDPRTEEAIIASLVPAVAAGCAEKREPGEAAPASIAQSPPPAATAMPMDLPRAEAPSEADHEQAMGYVSKLKAGGAPAGGGAAKGM